MDHEDTKVKRPLQKAPETLHVTPPTQSTEPVREAWLVQIYSHGYEFGVRYQLIADNVLLGRDPECAIHLDNNAVSRRHAEIVRQADGFHISDLGSTNGTLVNEAPVQTALLRDGDYVQVGECVFRFLASSSLEARYHEEIYRLAIMDSLTGVHNRRYLEEVLHRELTRADRRDEPIALVLVDIDHFKEINDHLGHLTGDYVLRELAGCLQENIRSDELLARYGGDEFIVVMSGANHEAAHTLAERLRMQVEQRPFAFYEHTFHMTISLGVAVYDGRRPMTCEELIQLADENLLAAKQSGRNCTFANAPLSEQSASREAPNS